MTANVDDAATIATQPASNRERRVAALLVAVLVTATALALGVSHRAGYQLSAFVAAYAGSTAMADALTTALLYVLYRTEGRRDILLATLAYALNTMLIVPYVVTFPNLVGAYGFVGNLQSSATLWVCWHFTFAICVALGFGARGRGAGTYDRALLLRYVAIAVAIAIVLTLVATVGRDALPVFVVDQGRFSPLFRSLALGVSALTVASIYLILRRATLSSLRLWLAVALVASALDTALNCASPGRFSAAWYVGKFEQFVTASVVMISLLHAWSASQQRATALALRLAAAAEQRRLLQDDFDREHRASQAFQEAALPSIMPIVPGLAFAAVYRAANRDVMVGGDWYDAFRIDDGRIVMSVGDVMGTGLAAAVTMNAVRQSLRGAAQLFPDPIAILNAADRALRSERPESIVTAFVAVIDPATRILSYASAGHPPAILRSPGGAVRRLDGSGLPLGIRSTLGDGEREKAHTVELPDPSMLVLYTDGLTESKRDVVDGEERLLAYVSGDAITQVRDPASAIANALIHNQIDDMAIVTVVVDGSLRDGVRETEHGIRWTFPSADGGRAAAVRGEIGDVLVAMGATQIDLANAGLILSELIGNVYRHAGGDVEVVLDTSGVSPVVHVLDRGTGFTFVSRLPSSMLSESGRGLFVVSQIAHDFSVSGRLGGGSHARAVLPFSSLVRNL